MKTLYAYFILSCHTYYVRTGRIGPLESALFNMTLTFGMVLISISVLLGKLFEIQTGALILFAMILTYVFHTVQRRIIKPSFLSTYARRFSALSSKSNWRLVLTIVAPIATIVLFLLSGLIYLS
jgi:hypothetical protein